MGISRARVTWFAVISGRPGLGTPGTLSLFNSRSTRPDGLARLGHYKAGPDDSVVTHWALMKMSFPGAGPTRSITSFRCGSASV
jgi:hypothetical protein